MQQNASARRLGGIILITLSAAAFGTLAILGRFAYADGVNAVTILFFRFGLAAVVMLGYLFARGETLPRGNVLWPLIGMGAIGYVGQSFSYLTAVQYASAGLVALLLYLYPSIVALLAVLFLREQFTRSKAAALSLAFVGTALTVGPGGGQVLGIALAISAALIYSVYILVGVQVLKQVSAAQSSTVIFAAAGAMAGLLMAITGPQLPHSSTGWAAIGGIVLIATVLPVVAFLVGLEQVGPTTAAMLSTVEPVVTVWLAVWLLAEPLQPLVLVGGALILAAVLLLTRAELGASPRETKRKEA